MGEYQHNIDDKGRLIIPAKLRDCLGSTFILTRGLDQCLFVYPMNEWKTLEQQLQAMPVMKSEARAFTRFFFSGATACEWDKQGRIHMAAHLRQYAQLEKECVIIGVQNRVEIWSKPSWVKYVLQAESSFSTLAETLVNYRS